MITIQMVNEYGILIEEKDYDTDEPNEALGSFIYNTSVERGDVIKIR